MTVQHLPSVVADVPPVERDTDLVPVNLGKHFRITATGLTVIGEPDFETCEAFWNTAKTLEKSLAFAIGDAILYFERRFGEKASQIIDASGLSEETCRNYRWMADKVKPETRMLDRGLFATHHQAVARLPAAQQATWLRRAIEGDGEGQQWSVNRLRAEIKSGIEQVETGWYVMVTCDAKRKRDELQKKLELDGYPCKALTRHGTKETP
jgi:hypothetical protein